MVSGILGLRCWLRVGWSLKKRWTYYTTSLYFFSPQENKCFYLASCTRVTWCFIPQCCFRPSFAKFFEEVSREGFPVGSVVKNLPANAGDMGSIPNPGRSHRPWSNGARVPQLLSLCSRARELRLLSHVPPLLKPAHPGAGAPPQEEPPRWEAHSPQWEKNLCNSEDPAQPEIR